MSDDDPPISWDEWDKEISSPGAPWAKYKKGQFPPTQHSKFKQAVVVLADLLLEENEFYKYLSILAFLKNHPKINQILLQYAVVGADLRGNFTSRSLLSPVEVSHV